MAGFLVRSQNRAFLPMVSLNLPVACTQIWAEVFDQKKGKSHTQVTDTPLP